MAYKDNKVKTNSLKELANINQTVKYNNIRKNVDIEYIVIGSDWTYTSQDMGMVGTGYISDYTGNLTFVRNDFKMNNEFMPLSLSFYFSNYLRNVNIGYGNGWRTNFNYQVGYDSVSNRYYLFKPDGNKVYFMNETCELVYSGVEKCESIAEDGSRMLMVRNTYLGNNQNFRIATKSDIEYNFDSKGRLTSIRNIKTNHYLRVYYIDSTSNKIDYIIDEADNRIDFSYNAGNTLVNKTELKLMQSDGTLRTVEEKNYFFISNNLDYITQGFRYGTGSNTAMVYDNKLEYEFDSYKLLL